MPRLPTPMAASRCRAGKSSGAGHPAHDAHRRSLRCTRPRVGATLAIAKLLPCIALVLAAAVLAGCSHQFPLRPYVNVEHLDGDGCRYAGMPKAETTPEVHDDYTLHFVEFDDQGWLFPPPDKREWSGPRERVGNPQEQLNCAIADLKSKLQAGPVQLYVYVHGWHHNAGYRDGNVQRFRELLQVYADNRTTADRKTRRLVGLYIGWEGETLNRLPIASELTFWGRKNAADRISQGRIRELFGRLKGLREANNRLSDGGDCARASTTSSDACRFRVMMIGHSFGGLILFSATEPYLLETMASPLDGATASTAAARATGIADLVVLLNPAFEAARYEPLLRVAERAARVQGPAAGQAPILVSVTSTADWATLRAFPAARKLNTVFQYPAATALEAETIRDTVGNVGAYRTHQLCMDGPKGSCFDLGIVEKQQVCESLSLLGLPKMSDLPLWNVQTFKDVVRDHNDVLNPHTVNFMQFVYMKAVGGSLACIGEDKGPRYKAIQSRQDEPEEPSPGAGGR